MTKILFDKLSKNSIFQFFNNVYICPWFDEDMNPFINQLESEGYNFKKEISSIKFYDPILDISSPNTKGIDTTGSKTLFKFFSKKVKHVIEIKQFSHTHKEGEYHIGYFLNNKLKFSYEGGHEVLKKDRKMFDWNQGIQELNDKISFIRFIDKSDDIKWFDSLKKLQDSFNKSLDYIIYCLKQKYESMK